MTNPILSDWNTPFEIAPFDTISDDDFSPALKQAMHAHDAEIEAIAASPDTPTFANTIEALEAAGEQLDKVLSVFFTVAGADSNPKREELQREFSPKLAAHYSRISSNKALFKRVADLWDRRDNLDLTDEQARVLMLSHRGFMRAGAALTGADLARLATAIGVVGTSAVGWPALPDAIARHDAAINEAHARGAFGVPSFFVGDEMFFGNDRLVLLEDRLTGRSA